MISRSLAIGAAATAAVLGLRIATGHDRPAASAGATPPPAPAPVAAPRPAPVPTPPTRLEMARYLTSDGMASLLEKAKDPIADGRGVAMPVAPAAAVAHDAVSSVRPLDDWPR